MQHISLGKRYGIAIAGTMVSLVLAESPSVGILLGQPSAPARPPSSLAQVPDPSQNRPDPNRDRLLPVPSPSPTTPPEPEPILPSPSPSPTTPAEPVVKIPVSKIEVTGSTIFTPKDWQPITAPLEGREVTLEELRQAADSITQLYLERGYITSRAILVDQTIENGVVQIRVVEGRLERIEIEGNQHVKEEYIRSRIRLGAKAPLSRDGLEDQLRLLKVDPLFTNVEASLRSGTGLGQSILIVRVTEAPRFGGFIGVDNYSPPRVGSVRLGGGVSYRNITGYGDRFFGSFYRTTAGGANTFDFLYQLPLNPMEGTLTLRAAPNDNVIVDSQFRALNISGISELYELSFRQPLVRNPREEFALSLGFTYQNSQTFFAGIPFPFGFGPDSQGRSKTRVLKFGQDYINRDPQGAWALRSQFSLGLDIFDATTNASPVPDGRFFSWLGQVQRVQRLGNNHLLIVQGDLQLTPDSLLPSQQFVIGGGLSVRGFQQNIRSGDNGFRFSVEDRIALVRDQAGIPTLQLAPFFDMGSVWNVSSNPNNAGQPSKRFLAGLGLGLLYQPHPQLFMRLDYGIPLVDLPDRGNDVQSEGFYFSVNYQF